ncbi:MAG: ubiquitin-conjugating enzyme E2 [Candidatus Freyarchaeota archaeon]|nr:ubiquitin-conjugating enzyme E2 [Candidatus Jordarchaeia archaeon]MBS7269927.1 ubiquitin-conjugating enzyme E2 [Candidatus Jordarchaeia archaeon]MBS7280150.1 ubiquitin-conjugating enzyme E2 [Candidatus Jordarchaeia archaeon]
MRREEPTFHSVDGKLTHWRGIIYGSAGSPYEGGMFKVEIKITRRFPFEPPEVLWHTRIWHPNIAFGDRPPFSVCIAILGREWKPQTNIVGVIEALRTLLNNPNPDNPLNSQAAYQQRREPQKFREIAREYVLNYANQGW